MSIDDIGYIKAYRESFREVLESMAGVKSTVSDPSEQEISFNLSGMAVIIGITGKCPGRIILGLSPDAAARLASSVSDEQIADEDYMMDVIAEFCNIVAGHATTKVNNAVGGLNLILTPPSIFSGVDMGIISPRIKSQLLKAETGIGDIYISIGFERGHD